MLIELVVTIWAVASLAYVLQPAVTDTPTELWDSSYWLTEDRDTEPTRRAIADGGRVCQNCGSHLGGDYTYCGECLTPVV
jgi:hypothetical protein